MKTSRTKMEKRRHQQGFTLIEIMIVLAIIGVIFSFVGVNVINKFRESQVDAAKIQMASFENTLQQFYLDNSFYPHTSQGLEALVSKPTAGREPKNYSRGGYLNKKTLPDDPWGNPYRYECDNYQEYSIASDGPDGESDTDDDIFLNDDRKEE